MFEDLRDKSHSQKFEFLLETSLAFCNYLLGKLY